MSPLGSHLAHDTGLSGAARLYLRAVGHPDPAMRVRGRRSIRYLRDKRPKRILDAGCGAGMITIPLAQSLPDTNVIGVDLHQYQVEVGSRLAARARVRNVSFLACDLHEYEPSGGFDAVLMNDALGSILDPPTILKRIWSWLEPGGKLVLTCPTHDVPRILRSFKRADPHDFGFLAPGYSRTELDELLTAAGFRVLSVRPILTRPAEFAYEIVDPVFGLARGRHLRALLAPLAVLLTYLDHPIFGGATGWFVVAERPAAES